VSWTRLGHLLYVDARQAGFSYNRMERVGDELAVSGSSTPRISTPISMLPISSACSCASWPPSRAAEPAGGDRGESYGGVRATAMLHLLLNYADYGNGRETFQDPALAAEIQAHLQAVFPATPGKPWPAEVIARQFGRQVLVQPTLVHLLPVAGRGRVAQPAGLRSLSHRRGGRHPLRSPALSPIIMNTLRSRRESTTTCTPKPRDWLDGFFKTPACSCARWPNPLPGDRR